MNSITLGSDLLQKIINLTECSLRALPFKRSAWLLLLFLFVANIQDSNGQNSQPSKSLELQVIDIEQKYDTQVIQSLSNYFDRNKFIVDVQIDAEIVEETVTVEQPQTVRERASNARMPGLPFLPEENLRNREADRAIQENVEVQTSIRTLNLLNITVNVYADTSFTDDQRDFIRLIASIAAKINEPRGDVVNVSSIIMPSIGEQPVEPDSEPAGMTAMISNINDFIPWLILILLLVLTVIGARIAREPKVNPDPNRRKYREGIKNELDSEDNLIKEVPNPVFEKPKPESRADKEIDELLKNFFNRPHEIALLFEYWMDDHNEEGAIKAAEVINTVDKHLLRSLVNQLSPENYQVISKKIETLPSMSEEQKLKIAQKFNSILRSSGSNSDTANKHGQLDLFPFLSHLSISQISNLIENENNRVAALVFDYLPGDRAAKLLDNMPPERSAEIMLEMTTLHNLSYKEHRRISSDLFEKAMSFIDSKKDERYAVENVMPVIKKIPLENQKQYIDNLIASGSPIGHEIKKRFITIDQIPELSDEIIRHAVQSINTETLIAALSGFDEATIHKILTARPKREQRLIMQELQTPPDPNSIHSQRAKLYLVNEIRKTAETLNNEHEIARY